MYYTSRKESNQFPSWAIVHKGMEAKQGATGSEITRQTQGTFGVCSCTDACNAHSPPVKDVLQRRKTETFRKKETINLIAIQREKDISQTWVKPESSCGHDFFFHYPLLFLTLLAAFRFWKQKVEFHHKQSWGWGWSQDSCWTAGPPPR